MSLWSTKVHPAEVLFRIVGLSSLLMLGACKPQVSASGVSSEKAVVIGVQPNEKDRDLGLFREEVGRRLGRTVKTFVPKDYGELVQKFRAGEVDFAFFSPLTFLQAEREAAAKALLKKVYGHSEFYYSAIIVRKQSSYKDLASLKGKKFGFVDPKSTSGFLVPRVMARQAGWDPAQGPHEFFGTHQDAVQALLDKKVEAVGVWSDEAAEGTGAWSEKDFDRHRRDFRVLKVSDPIPNDAFAVREDYYKAHPLVVYQMMEILIGLSEDPAHLLKKVFHVDGLATATSRHYESVRALEALMKEE